MLFQYISMTWAKVKTAEIMYQTTTLLTFLLVIIQKTTCLNLCNRESLLSQNITSYRYRTEQVQNCNCPDKTNCVRKCCADGFRAGKGVCLPYEDTNFEFIIPIYNGETFVRNASVSDGFLAGVMSCVFFRLNINETAKDYFYIQEDGTLWTSKNGQASNDKYCVDHIGSYGLSAFFCYEASVESAWKANVAGMIISIPFLLATFIAYALLPDRNLHMKALMFYVINLMSSYIILVVIQLSNSRFDDLICSLLGYFCLFFFLVSFLWMNVICFDIWFTFSGLRGFSGSKKITERKRFFVYCGYAWGVPALHVLGVLAIDRWAQPSSFFHPGIGFGQCFLKQGVPELLYFHGPMAILITINIILFAITAFKIRAIKKDTTSVLKKEDSKRHSYENDKQTFNLYLKLLFAMGVNWSMEIISWAVNWAQKAPDSVWYLTDFCNAIYGVFIFFIFVFKKNIWKLLKKRYYSFIGKPHLAHSMTVSNTTRATSYSTANTMNGVTDTSTLTSEA